MACHCIGEKQWINKRSASSFDFETKETHVQGVEKILVE